MDHSVCMHFKIVISVDELYGLPFASNCEGSPFIHIKSYCLSRKHRCFGVLHDLCTLNNLMLRKHAIVKMNSKLHNIGRPSMTSFSHGGLVSQVQSLLCPICQTPMMEPKLLSCGHTFCFTCLKRLVIEKKIVCPLCRVETSVQNSKAASLPRNLAFESVAEEVSKLEEKCDLCNSISKSCNIVFCFDCNVTMCQDCKELHDKNKQNSNHSLRMSHRRDKMKDKTPVSNYCSTHKHEICSHICVTCHTIICTMCSKQHEREQHDVKRMLAYEYEIKIKATSLAKEIREMKIECTSHIQETDYYKQRTTNHIDKIISQVTEEHKSLTDRIAEEKVSLLKPCLDMKEKITRMSEAYIKNIENNDSLLTRANSSIEGITQAPFEDVQSHGKIFEISNSTLNDIKEKEKNISKQLLRIVKEGDMLSFEKSSSHNNIIGELILNEWVRKEVPLRKSAQMTCTAVDQRSRVLIGYFKGGVDVVGEKGSEGVIDLLKEVCVMAMAFSNNGNLVLRDIHNVISVYEHESISNKLKRQDTTFDTVKHEEGGDGDLALDSNNNIYASYRIMQKIHVYQIDGGKPFREIDCDGFNPQQILVMSNLELVIMNASTIRILDVNRETKYEVTRKGFLGYPAVAWDGTLLIAWVKSRERTVEIIKYSYDMKNKTTLFSNKDIDLARRRWYYFQVLADKKVAFCTPKQLHIFTLHVSPYGMESTNDNDFFQ